MAFKCPSGKQNTSFCLLSMTLLHCCIKTAIILQSSGTGGMPREH